MISLSWCSVMWRAITKTKITRSSTPTKSKRIFSSGDLSFQNAPPAWYLICVALELIPTIKINKDISSSTYSPFISYKFQSRLYRRVLFQQKKRFLDSVFQLLLEICRKSVLLRSFFFFELIPFFISITFRESCILFY